MPYEEIDLYLNYRYLHFIQISIKNVKIKISAFKTISEACIIYFQ